MSLSSHLAGSTSDAVAVERQWSSGRRVPDGQADANPKRIVNTNQLVVVGVGHVESHVLVGAMKTDLFGKIGVIDLLENVACGETLDQAPPPR